MSLMSKMQDLQFNQVLMDSKRNELQELSDRRTKLIKECLVEGHSVMTISKAANISRQRVYIILNKGE